MERYHPRVGLWCLIVAVPTWITLLINGMLGFFPAIMFADGGVGQKFHFWLFIQDKLGLFGGSPDPVWSEAGVMTSQEWIMLVLALPTTLAAIYCLRRRPEFGAIERNDDFSDRESLEVGSIGVSFSGGGDAHTQSIVESVIGQKESLDDNVVSAALGEMGVIAAANAAEAAEKEELESEQETILDSRFTTTILDEDELDMVSAFANEEEDSSDVEDSSDLDEMEEDDTGWGVWEPEIVEERPSEPEIEVLSARKIPEIPEIFREPISEEPDRSGDRSIPEIPLIEEIIVIEEPEVVDEPVVIDEPKPNLGKRITNIATNAADSTVSVTKDVVSATVSGARGVASIAAGITGKVVGKVRKKSTKGVMPVRPPGLPSMAEWDANQGTWTLMGRPVQIVSTPEPEIEMPSWAQNETESTPTQNVPVVQSSTSNSTRRNTPFIPELP